MRSRRGSSEERRWEKSPRLRKWTFSRKKKATATALLVDRPVGVTLTDGEDRGEQAKWDGTDTADFQLTVKAPRRSRGW